MLAQHCINVHGFGNIGPTYAQCQCFGWVVRPIENALELVKIWCKLGKALVALALDGLPMGDIHPEGKVR